MKGPSFLAGIQLQGRVEPASAHRTPRAAGCVTYFETVAAWAHQPPSLSQSNPGKPS